ncbi:uncharacterized protein MONBRDRAFT_11663 [Monosiga brevicollis MX1]|uniref:Uncharacterized protein n=1 Tax=Monosiga brevicollis TaxID=81824 RepID=A9V9X5_MONBE|nr:uncharacterized protein MONBRDRAFT_11663 [Monosiga brevicollis MX1]EDQ85633.1 predicted protein [Monosiga brevicollis MX1]|eukprot:XP_001749582.1 hypothetical protein [Monosiga brevicollis MX1]
MLATTSSTTGTYAGGTPAKLGHKTSRPSNVSMADSILSADGLVSDREAPEHEPKAAGVRPSEDDLEPKHLQSRRPTLLDGRPDLGPAQPKMSLGNVSIWSEGVYLNVHDSPIPSQRPSLIGPLANHPWNQQSLASTPRSSTDSAATQQAGPSVHDASSKCNVPLVLDPLTCNAPDLEPQPSNLSTSPGQAPRKRPGSRKERFQLKRTCSTTITTPHNPPLERTPSLKRLLSWAGRLGSKTRLDPPAAGPTAPDAALQTTVGPTDPVAPMRRRSQSLINVLAQTTTAPGHAGALERRRSSSVLSPRALEQLRRHETMDHEELLRLRATTRQPRSLQQPIIRLPNKGPDASMVINGEYVRSTDPVHRSPRASQDKGALSEHTTAAPALPAADAATSNPEPQLGRLLNTRLSALEHKAFLRHRVLNTPFTQSVYHRLHFTHDDADISADPEESRARAVDNGLCLPTTASSSAAVPAGTGARPAIFTLATPNRRPTETRQRAANTPSARRPSSPDVINPSTSPTRRKSRFGALTGGRRLSLFTRSRASPRRQSRASRMQSNASEGPEEENADAAATASSPSRRLSRFNPLANLSTRLRRPSSSSNANTTSSAGASPTNTSGLRHAENVNNALAKSPSVSLMGSVDTHEEA